MQRHLRAALFALLAAAIAACAGPPNGGTPAPIRLLVPNYGIGQLEILSTDDDLDDLARGTALTSATGTCGVAVGPDGRLYVADYDASLILVYALPAALAGGDVVPAATLASDDLGGPCGLTFDGDGTLWVGDYWSAQVLAFRGVDAFVSGDNDLNPDVILTIGGVDVEPFAGIYDVFVDGSGALWVADASADAVSRIDDVADLDGVVANRVPDLQVQGALASTPPPAGGTYTFETPYAVAIDAAGNLYVGNLYEDYVVRFDGYASQTGILAPQPDAYLVTPIESPYLVAVDADGSLWVGNETELARLPAPASGAGVVTPVPTAAVTYAADGGYNDGGGMRFLPTPAGLGF